MPGTDLGPRCWGIGTGGFRRRALWSAHWLVYGCALTALTVLPASPPPLLSAVSVNPTSVVGGNSST